MSSSIKDTVQSFTMNQALNYLEGNPEKNIPRLMELVDHFMPESCAKCTRIVNSCPLPTAR